MKVRDPQMGYSVSLEGPYIEHKALRAFGSKERITSLTSFRPRNLYLPDKTVPTTVSPVLTLDQLYGQYAEDRFEFLQKRSEDQIKTIRDTSSVDCYQCRTLDFIDGRICSWFGVILLCEV